MDFNETQHQDSQMSYVPMPLEVCNLDKPFRRYHVCTEDWSTAGRTHSAGQEGNWLRSAFTRTDPQSTNIYHMSHAADRAQRSIREAMNRARSIPRHAIKASGRTHRSTRKAKDYGRPRSSPHDQDHHITADPDGRPHPLHGRPEVREQEAHLCSFNLSWPVSPQPTCGRPRAL
ncbi:unnamed protein product [Microthlaspi erraticum]|uniref:Uncharacterized protein n=1 Tax=Microthlaspi erraticum TaxID=1685480 RepID=A0A6D2JWI1_9BRAS|nr:unnamed protein product [Microthlaspi erraticum]